MLRKLRIKFVCMNMTIITILLAVMLCLVVQVTRTAMEAEDHRMLQEIAADPLRVIAPGGDSAVRQPYFTLRLDNGKRVREIIGSDYRLSDADFLQEIIGFSTKAAEENGLIPGHNLRFLRFSTPAGDFLSFMDISTEVSALDKLARNCILIGIFSFFAFLAISIFFAHWSVRPVDQAWNQQKQFIADASHELKTPLTVILTSTELLQSPECGDQKKERCSENIRLMAKRMQGLVEGLLELSRIDSGTVKATRDRVNLTAAVERAIYPFEPLYFESGRELVWELEPGLCVRGSGGRLSQAAEILLDNALKYASPGLPVTVRLKRSRRFCLLSVESFGEDMSPQELERIFRRFYRGDSSRNSGGYGLGLPIARSIVKEHGGKIWAESREGVNTFFVRVPCLLK